MNYKSFILYLLFFILLLSACNGSQVDKFAQCLTDKGVTMYGADWCKSCQNQKKFFGTSFQYINYVNCDFNEATCNELGITAYPVWLVNNTLYTGIQTFETLGQLSSCEST